MMPKMDSGRREVGKGLEIMRTMELRFWEDDVMARQQWTTRMRGKETRMLNTCDFRDLEYSAEHGGAIRTFISTASVTISNNNYDS